MKITEMLEKISEQICDKYCKYPEIYDDQDLMIESECCDCPLVKYL